MSAATKRKHVTQEVLLTELTDPTAKQQIVRVTCSRGNNLHEVQGAHGTSPFLVSMPPKFRKNVWVKRGDYILVEPIEEGDKVKAEMVKVLTPDYVRFLKNRNLWPTGFEDEKEEEEKDEDDLFVNTNRRTFEQEDDTESDSE